MTDVQFLFGFRTSNAEWEIERVPNWRCWMWARPYGNTQRGYETFWRIGPLHIKRWTARRAHQEKASDG